MPTTKNKALPNFNQEIENIKETANGEISTTTNANNIERNLSKFVSIARKKRIVHPIV